MPGERFKLEPQTSCTVVLNFWQHKWASYYDNWSMPFQFRLHSETSATAPQYRAEVGYATYKKSTW
jgi:hypothetical protein